MKLIWVVVEAVNKVPSLEQIAKEFKEKSMAGFDNCAGCIDVILIWIHKPDRHILQSTKCGQSKFFCGIKIGLNMQATCDA
jgi:hypothetical protein